MERKTSKLTIALVVLLLLAATVTTAISQDNPKVIDLNALAARGEALAHEDPLATELRNQQPEGPARHGFDIGMAAAEGQTLPGPGKQRIHDALRPAEQGGFDTAVAFSLERNRNADLAAKGAAIAKADPVVAAARAVETDVFYWLGFDIATGIFGDPALGARGNTATGPGSLKIRDSLSAAGQRGFDASVKLHLSRNYKRSRTIRDGIRVDDPVPANAIRVNVRYRKEYGYHWAEGPYAGSGPTSCDEFFISARLGDGNDLPIGGDSQMQESFGYYTCKYLVAGLSFNVPVKITVTIANNREAWQGGSLAQPPPGQQRVIQNGIQTATLTEAEPRATLVFEMIYAAIPPR